MRKKKGLKIIKRGYRTENYHASTLLSNPPLPRSVVGIEELMPYRKAAGCEFLLSTVVMIQVLFSACIW